MTNKPDKSSKSENQTENPNPVNPEPQKANNAGKKSYSDIFIRNTTFQDASAIFSFQAQPLESIKAECIVVLDTNVLLLPYNLNKQNFIQSFLDQCRRIYGNLIKDNRLKIPRQVAREFAANRPNVLTALYKQLEDTKSKFSGLPSIPSSLLDSLEIYKGVIDKISQINKLQKEVSDDIGNLLNQIMNWQWNDPVSQLYSELFTPSTIEELDLTSENTKTELKEELTRRQEHQIPPCVSKEDQGKADSGIGDFLIWKTILQLGQTAQKPLLLISADKKADWFHQHQGVTLYPRFELVEEYRRVSGGYTLHILELSELLKLFKADDKVIETIAQQEKVLDLWQDINLLPGLNHERLLNEFEYKRQLQMEKARVEREWERRFANEGWAKVSRPALIKAGTRIRHIHYGIGLVVSNPGLSGIAQVAFDKKGPGLIKIAQDELYVLSPQNLPSSENDEDEDDIPF